MVKKIVSTVTLIASLYAPLSANTLKKEKLFVVERESSSVAVIEDGLPRNHMQHMHNMNHGVMKFYENDGYLISRDGYIMRFNPLTEKKLSEYKTSKSAIGFVIAKNFVAVANYDDKSVDILSRDLKMIQKIKTDSRNVGIKIYKDYLVFSEMDKDTIAVYKNMTPKEKKPHFQLYKEFKDVGVMPFDALIDNNTYVNGFFNSPWIGKLNLDTMQFSKVPLKLGEREPVLKVPHFGFWSVSNAKVFIPAVGDNKVFVFTPDFKYITSIKTEGMPVFTALSPDKKYLAVTFSGKKFPVIQIIDTKTLKIIKRFQFKGKVLHVRWSNIRPELYVSVNDANEVVVLDTKDWWIKREILTIKKPSGIFLFDYEETK